MLEGRAATIWDASGVAPDDPNTAKLSLLNAALVHQREVMQQAGVTRSGSAVEIRNSVVQATPDGRVQVFADVKRTWTETGGSTARTTTTRTQTAAGTTGTVEGIESTLSIFVHDRCGDLTIIDAPLPNYEDTSDGHDPCSGMVHPDGTIEEVCEAPGGGDGGSCAAAVRLNSQAAVSSSCSGNGSQGPSGTGRCQAAKTRMFCEVEDNLGAKGWFFRTTMQSYWSEQESEGTTPARALWSLSKPDAQKNAFMQKATLYPGKNSGYGWGSAFAKALAKDKSTKIGISGAACFLSKRVNVDISGTISANISPFKWGEVGAGVLINPEAEEKCSDYKVAKDSDSTRLTVEDERNLVRAECVFNNASGDNCKITRYRQAMIGDLNFDFMYKGTNSNGKPEGKHYLSPGVIRHEFTCQVERAYDEFLFIGWLTPTPGKCTGLSNLRGRVPLT
ncbi:hypothetical protein ABGB18_43130 [Nonomuraea sp. B12E4]|uniref:hypothetical protein n=1 Tax=Nonomuraea sp. B12E4 TaxID=3153564 RepID=UPI00325C91C6